MIDQRVMYPLLFLVSRSLGEICTFKNQYPTGKTTTSIGEIDFLQRNLKIKFLKNPIRIIFLIREK